MTTNYTPADVSALITTLDQTLSMFPAITEEQQAAAVALEVSLRPFRPNPEEELIDAMSAAYSERTKQLVGYGISTPTHREAMRDALAVVKERGLPV